MLPSSAVSWKTVLLQNTQTKTKKISNAHSSGHVRWGSCAKVHPQYPLVQLREIIKHSAPSFDVQKFPRTDSRLSKKSDIRRNYMPHGKPAYQIRSNLTGIFPVELINVSLPRCLLRGLRFHSAFASCLHCNRVRVGELCRISTMKVNILFLGRSNSIWPCSERSPVLPSSALYAPGRLTLSASK